MTPTHRQYLDPGLYGYSRNKFHIKVTQWFICIHDFH